MTPQARLIATAQSQDGYLGKKSNSQLDSFTANAGGKFNKFARDLDAIMGFYNGKKQGADWCDVYVDWCFVQTFGVDLALALTCQPKSSCGAGTAYSLGYYRARGQLFTEPQPGDQIFFGDGKSTWHTGIVTAVRDGCVFTEEGNSGVKSGVHSFKYPIGSKSIKGYGRPDWSLVPDESEEENDMAVTYKTLADVPDWYKPTVDKLVKAGALNGTGDGLNVSEDFCRTMTVLDRLGKLD